MLTETISADARTVELRVRMLEAAERLLNESPDHDISTRAVCEAVGVGQPILYRLFGDKEGLLKALVDSGFDRYAIRKQALESTGDPVADLYAGWDDHMEFALTNRALYRLMFSPALSAVPAAAGRIFELLKAQLDRCAAVGAAKLPSDKAAQAILSANVGVALSMLSQPHRYSDPDLSHHVRDAVFATCVTRQISATTPDPESSIVRTALQLEAQIRTHATTLGSEEQALLLKWLQELQPAGR